MALKINTKYREILTSKGLNEKVNDILGGNALISGFEVTKQGNTTVVIKPGKCVINGAIIEETSTSKQLGANQHKYIALRYNHKTKTLEYISTSVVADNDLIIANIETSNNIISKIIMTPYTITLSEIAQKVQSLKDELSQSQDEKFTGEGFIRVEGSVHSVCDVGIKGNTLLNTNTEGIPTGGIVGVGELKNGKYEVNIASRNVHITNDDYVAHVATFGISNIQCVKCANGRLKFTTMGGWYEHDFRNKKTLKLLPNTKYSLKMIIDQDTTAKYIIAGGIDKKKINNKHYEFTTDDSGLVAIYPFSVGAAFVNKEFDIIIEPTESFKDDSVPESDKISYILDEPLYSLPGEIYDEITSDGKLIKKISQFKASWITRGVSVNNNASRVEMMRLNDIGASGSACMCDNPLYTVFRGSDWVNVAVDYETFISMGYQATQASCEQFLRDNPVNIIYVKYKSTTTQLTSIRKLKTFNNVTYISANTTVNPVITINTPTNIGAAIRRDTDRLTQLEDLIDGLILPGIVDVDYKRELFGFKFNYNMNRK